MVFVGQQYRRGAYPPADTSAGCRTDLYPHRQSHYHPNRNAHVPGHRDIHPDSNALTYLNVTTAVSNTGSPYRYTAAAGSAHPDPAADRHAGAKLSIPGG